MSDTEDKAKSVRGGVSGLGLLGIMFVGLKLTGFIDWSWWWVTAPFWGPAAVVSAFVVGAFAVTLLIVWLEERAAEKRQQSRVFRDS